MRGALHLLHAHYGRVGIIPAYAGSTKTARCKGQKGRDHPRVCGEHSAQSCVTLVPPGSSPRMRGAPLERLKASAARGIIPAYAGSTYFWYEHGRKCRDHPRVYGEHRGFLALGAGFQGSSPRMRGALPVPEPLLPQGGIIPAYAGSTGVHFCSPLSRWDHPRVCGEHSASAVSVSAAQGSSPRMRGAHHIDTSGIAALGIIPAYAGSTSAARR